MPSILPACGATYTLASMGEKSNAKTPAWRAMKAVLALPRCALLWGQVVSRGWQEAQRRRVQPATSLVPRA